MWTLLRAQKETGNLELLRLEDSLKYATTRACNNGTSNLGDGREGEREKEKPFSLPLYIEIRTYASSMYIFYTTSF